MEDVNRQLEATYEEIVDVLATRLKTIWEIVDNQRKETIMLKTKLAAAREPLEDLRQIVFTLEMEPDQRELIDNVITRLTISLST
ncbi:MAG: hypothetical protein NTV58_13885 [Deltaproteobacteria bacterium]|nr:hypothetical protein [Deltaproteobacteria bacterium]